MAAKKEVDEAESFQRFVQEVIFSGNERAGVICGAAMLDLQLETILRKHLLPAKSAAEDERLFGANAPLATFSGKITMAYRLGLIPPVVADMIDRIRKIRNDFAHDVAIGSLNDDDKYKSHIAELSRVHRGTESAMLDRLKMEINPANRFRAIVVAVATMLSSTAKLVQVVEPLGMKFSADDLFGSPAGSEPKGSDGPSPRAATLREATAGRTVAVVGDVYRFLATGEDTSGKYAFWEALVPPGGGPPPHVHSREEEGFYVLEGEITFTINGEKVVAKAGTFANMPVGTPHSFKNESDQPAKMLVSVAPAGLEQMFFEVGVPLAEGATTALPPTKEEIEKLLAVCTWVRDHDSAAGALRDTNMTTTYTHILDLAKEAEPPADGILSRTIFQDDKIKAVIFGFGQGEELSEHTAAKPAMLFFVKGEASVGLGDDMKDAQAGTWVHMPAGMKHSINAKTPVVMLLVLLK